MQPAWLRLVVIGAPALVLAFVAGLAVGARMPDPAKPRIEVRAETLAAQVVNRAAMIGRDLSDAEIADITGRQIGIEVLIREAAKLNVHLKNADIRKHMVSAMTHVLSGQVPEPTERDLAAYFDAHRDRYKTPQRVSFEHVFFAEDQAAAEVLVNAVSEGADMPEKAGDIFWLGRDMDAYSSGQLLTVLGHEFVQALADMPVGIWTGPIKSGRGWHIVRLKARHEPQPLPDAERDRRLRDDWRKHHHAAEFEQRVEAMRVAYDIALPQPETLHAAIAARSSRSRSIWANEAQAPRESE